MSVTIWQLVNSATVRAIQSIVPDAAAAVQGRTGCILGVRCIELRLFNRDLGGQEVRLIVARELLDEFAGGSR